MYLANDNEFNENIETNIDVITNMLEMFIILAFNTTFIVLGSLFDNIVHNV